jgi:hypothetical protein
MPAGMGGNEHTAVVELHQAAVADHLDGLAGQPHPRLVLGGGEADRPAGGHPRVVTGTPASTSSGSSASIGPGLGMASRNRSKGGTRPID